MIALSVHVVEENFRKMLLQVFRWQLISTFPEKAVLISIDCLHGLSF